MNKKELVEVEEKKCEEINNCTSVRVVDGKRCCRGCGNVQPEGVPVAGITSEINIQPKIERKNMNCLYCNFYDKNDPVHAWGTCEPQDEDFHCTHDCNLTEKEVRELENLTGCKREN